MPGTTTLYKKGYEDGRSGKTAQSKDADYRRGWKQGEFALEEAQSKRQIFTFERER